MRALKRCGSFFMNLLLYMLINFRCLLIPLVLLGLHFWTGISIWWSVAALLLWTAWMLISVAVFSYAHRCGTEPKQYRENKNPYSHKGGI